MGQSKARSRLHRIVAGTVAIFLCVVCTGLTFGLIPPTELLARLYLNAAVNKNAGIAVFLASAEPTCQDYVREDIQKDTQKFGGVEIRNLTIEIAYNTGSDEGLQFALLDFEYRQPDQLES